MADLRGWFNFRKVYDWVAQEFRVSEPIGDTCVTITPRFVEIGVWKGASIIHLCQRLIEVRGTDFDLFAVDPWYDVPAGRTKGEKEASLQVAELQQRGATVRDVFVDNLRDFGLEDQVSIMPMEGAQAAPLISEADFVFLDGDHRTDAVITDIQSWQDRVGILAGHDAYQGSVREALEHCFGRDGYWASTASGGCWTTYRKLGEYIVGLPCGDSFDSTVIPQESRNGEAVQNDAQRVRHCAGT